MAHAVHVQLRSFPLAEMIPFMFAPLAVTLGESSLAGQVDALAVPKNHNKINPLLAAIGTITPGKTLSVREMRLFCSATMFFIYKSHCREANFSCSLIASVGVYSRRSVQLSSPYLAIFLAPAPVPRRLFNLLTDPNAPHLDAHQNPPSEAGGVPPTRWLYLRKSNAANERGG